MRVLLTGSSGLIGRACAERLSAAGHELVGVARRPADTLGVSEALSVDIGSSGAGEEIADAVTRPCDAVIHAAAAIERDPASQAVVLTNCLGTQQMLRLAAAWRTRRFVYLSSIQVIGRPDEVPVTEAHTAAPASAYHASKLFGEQLVAVASDETHLGVSLRIAAPVGPEMPPDRIFPTFIARALQNEPLVVAGRGTRRQAYVDVRDVANAVELALASNVGGVLNVAGERSISNRELAELCVRQCRSSSEIRHRGDDLEEGIAWDVSIERARQELGYEPRCSLADSIDAVANEMRRA